MQDVQMFKMFKMFKSWESSKSGDEGDEYTGAKSLPGVTTTNRSYRYSRRFGRVWPNPSFEPLVQIQQFQPSFVRKEKREKWKERY